MQDNLETQSIEAAKPGNLGKQRMRRMRRIPLTEQRLFTVTDYADFAGVGRTTIYEAWKAGRGPECILVNQSRRIPRDAQWCSDGTPINHAPELQ
ncbi:hypothetical protein Thiosp_01944 [Thiorhodovibrio litoralis]|nr:hypothetical protein Thiosp_01944 [Thiorhodovibrio litoralis]